MTEAQRNALARMTGTSWCEIEAGTLLVTPRDGMPFLLHPDGSRDSSRVARVFTPGHAGRMTEA